MIDELLNLVDKPPEPFQFAESTDLELLLYVLGKELANMARLLPVSSDHFHIRSFDQIGGSDYVTSEGRILVRVMKFIKTTLKELDLDSTSSYIDRYFDREIISSILSRYKPHDYLYDVVSKFEWNAGDFGDGESCFWTYRIPARKLLAENSNLALRIYKKENGTLRGIARCWLDLWSSPEEVALFNAYGMRVDKMASLLQSLIGGKISDEVVVSNNSDLIWINDYVRKLYVGTERSSFHNLNIDCSAYETCSDCSHYFLYEELIEGFCQKCHEGREQCVHCGCWIGRNRGVRIEHQRYCMSCFDDLFVECYCCNRYIRQNDGGDYGQHYICKECSEQLQASTHQNCELCNCCGRVQFRSFMSKYEGLSLCRNCFYSRYESHIKNSLVNAQLRFTQYQIALETTARTLQQIREATITFNTAIRHPEMTFTTETACTLD